MSLLGRLCYALAGVNRRVGPDRRGNPVTISQRTAWGHFWARYDQQRNRRVATYQRRAQDRARVELTPYEHRRKAWR